MKTLYNFIIPLFVIVFIAFSCEKESETPVLTVDTADVTSITATSAQSGGEVTDDGGTSVTARGVCWSTSPNATTDQSKTSDGTGTGSFASSVTGLSNNELYFLRAYATNSEGTAYGNELSFIANSDGEKGSVTDIENNVYSTIIIGEQTWMSENLKTTKYNDDTGIPLVTDAAEWGNLTTPGYCWYENDESSYKDLYGALYNWYTVNTSKLCPSGWHVPTEPEWTTLIDYLGGKEVAGGKLKEPGTTHWLSPNTGATNASGFNAMSTGSRWPVENGGFVGGGSSEYTKETATFWSGTDKYEYLAWRLELHHFHSVADLGSGTKVKGESVRCVKDE